MTDVSIPAVDNTKPRLWVETLWLLESLTAKEPLREIPLQRGLNLIVSPSQAGSPGHGVGKTAFCQLLRFVLDDPLWSEGSSLRDELLNSSELKEGAVAARVHVGGEAWIVLKPWRHQKFYRASRTADWQQLAAGTAENEFADYQAALRQHLVDILPVQELPGSKQPIEWHHILAWCSRDQNARYQSYYQWRAEGTGFSLPAKSPAALMQIVLGLLRDASLLRALGKASKQIEAKKTELQELRDEPARLMKHVRLQLSRRLEAPNAIPFRQDGLINHPNLIGLAKQRQAAYQEELREVDVERKRINEARVALAEQLAPLNRRIGLLKNEIAQSEAIITGNVDEVERLRNEASSLQQLLPSWCDAGHRLLQDCTYVTERIDQTQFDRKQRTIRHQKSNGELERELATYRLRLGEAQEVAAPIESQRVAIDQQGTELDQRHAETLSSSQLLRDDIEDYEHYEAVAAGRKSSTAIDEAERKLATLQNDHAQLRIQADGERNATQSRRKVISEGMMAVAQSMPPFRWGVFNDDDKHRNRPFQMGPAHSTTFSVLEVLAGDVACLLDSASGESFHPGFLLHDSPREAEMSEALLWALLQYVAAQSATTFQYIVTTSTQPDEAFTPFVRLELSSDDNDWLLLRRRVGVHEAPLL